MNEIFFLKVKKILVSGQKYLSTFAKTALYVSRRKFCGFFFWKFSLILKSFIKKFRMFGEKHHQKSLNYFPLSRKSFWAEKFSGKINKVSPNWNKSFLNSPEIRGKLSELHFKRTEKQFAQKFFIYTNVSGVLVKTFRLCC